MTEPPDDLARLLAPTVDPPADPVRRADTLAATVNVLRRGWLLRRVTLIAGAAGLFVAGGVIGWVAKPAGAAVLVVPSPVLPRRTFLCR